MSQEPQPLLPVCVAVVPAWNGVRSVACVAVYTWTALGLPPIKVEMNSSAAPGLHGAGSWPAVVSPAPGDKRDGAGAEGVLAAAAMRWSGAQWELHPAKFGACKNFFFFFPQWGLNLAGTDHHPPHSQPWFSGGLGSSCDLPAACATAALGLSSSRCPRGAEQPQTGQICSSRGSPMVPPALQCPRSARCAPRPGFCHPPALVSSANFTCSDLIPLAFVRRGSESRSAGRAPRAAGTPRALCFLSPAAPPSFQPGHGGT